MRYQVTTLDGRFQEHDVDDIFTVLMICTKYREEGTDYMVAERVGCSLYRIMPYSELNDKAEATM